MLNGNVVILRLGKEIIDTQRVGLPRGREGKGEGKGG